MQTSYIMNKVKEYESFCKNPNFLDLVKAKKVFTLHLILNNTNLEKYTQNKEYIDLIPESNIAIALNGLEKDGFIKCKNSYWDSYLGCIPKFNGTEITINIDQNTARELDVFLGSFSEEFINYLKKRREEENQARLLLIADSKEKQMELQKKVDKLGGLVVDGLYHGGRRVMARVESKDREWQLSDDEKDLISAIGKNRIKKGMNRVDLLKKHGLHEAKEVAPVQFYTDDSGRLKIERDDIWGEKAKIYVDKRTFKQRVTEDWNWNDVLLLLLIPHLSITFYVTKKISTKATKVLFFSILISLILLGSTYGTNLHLTYIEQIWFALMALYLLLPIMILGIYLLIHALSSDDDWQ
ncbi:MAG: hypothetical protein ACSLFH_03495 [Desulfuromonadales bacterium]